MRLEGKTAIVTGAGRGIGRAAALALAEAGAAVAVNYNGSAAGAEETAEQIRKAGGRAFAIQANVAVPEDCERLVKETAERFGSVDILVNNAGITRDGLLIRMSEEDLNQVLDTNLKGTFYCMKAVSRFMMKQRRGRIINLSSVVGIHGNAGQTNYAASKAGIIGLTKAAAKELAARHITVNAVAPGFIETEMTAVLPAAAREAALAQIPAKEFGKPEDVAAVIVFLASEQAGYITGQVISADGGMGM